MGDSPRDDAPQVVYRNPLVGQIPFVTKSIIVRDILTILIITKIVIVVFYLIGLIIPGATSFLALIPAYTAPPWFFLWNLLTAGFFNTSFFSTLMNCLVLLSLGREIEPLWGSKEFLKYLIIITLLTSASTFFLMFFIYVITRVDMFLFSPISGFYGGIGALLIALRQLFPERVIPLLIGLKVRAKNLAAAYFMISVVFVLLTLKAWTLPFACFGLYYAWLYLRLFQTRSDGTRGDASPAFSFAAFFPDQFQSFISPVSTGCGLCFNRITFGYFPQPGSQIVPDIEQGNDVLQPTPSPSLQSPKPIDTVSAQESERRRARALRALDLRLGKENEKKDDAEATPET